MNKFSIQISVQNGYEFIASLFKEGEIIGSIGYRNEEQAFFIKLNRTLTVREMSELTTFALNLNDYYEHAQMKILFNEDIETMKRLEEEIQCLIDAEKHLLDVNKSIDALRQVFSPAEVDRFYIRGSLSGVIEGTMRAIRFLRMQSENVKQGIDFAPGVETKSQLEVILLRYWLDNKVKEIYKYKSSIKEHMASELVSNLDFGLFADMEDIASADKGEEAKRYKVAELLKVREETLLKGKVSS
ncbi:hypothetical protein ABD91_21380 [Lysinibacillus sphaericus]|uniref:hypothetical protein n=1 Tax=Lysinibacillus sphaericus TaxID=1421 RepID=UPI0018CD7B01|nr:hypothetical protein [Lysinibacillus sphaericus]MBG9693290.1 hypothetical protein [Lysinibacillus sphaericus]